MRSFLYHAPSGIRSTYFDSASECAAVAAFLIGLDTRLKTEPLKNKKRNTILKVQMTVDQIKRLLF